MKLADRIAELERRITELENQRPVEQHYHYHYTQPIVPTVPTYPTWPWVTTTGTQPSLQA